MKFIIQDFQASWAEDLLHQKVAIHHALIAFNATIEHIGSTSVVGLGAKPIIDILVGIEHDSSGSPIYNGHK